MSKIRMNTEYRNKLFNKIKDVFEKEETQEQQAFLQAREVFNAYQRDTFNVARKVVERSYPTEDVNTLRVFKILFKKSILFVDLIKNKLTVYCNFTGKIIMQKRFKFKRNKLFEEEIKQLKNIIMTGKHNSLSVKNNFLTNKLYNKLQKLKLEKL